MEVPYYSFIEKKVIIIRYCYRSHGFNEINYNEMLGMIEKYSALVIDVRSEQEYFEGHISGAINIPLYNIANGITHYVKDKSKVIIVYCSAGIRSMKAQKILNMRGYKNVYNLIEGYEL